MQLGSQMIVVTGFIGENEDGIITTLGRSGLISQLLSWAQLEKLTKSGSGKK